MVIETNSAKETFDAGYRLAQSVQPGQIYCLNGDLGVGKTVFTQGFAKGLGIEEPINSPTFTIVQEYHEADCRCTILMCTGSVTSARWMKSDMKTAFTGKA